MSTKIVVIKKEVLDRMADLRSELIMLAEQANESESEYSFLPLPTCAEAFTRLLDRKQVPYDLTTPSAT